MCRRSLLGLATLAAASCGSDSLSVMTPEPRPELRPDPSACPEGEPCDDGELCTFGDRCVDEVCVGAPYACDDDDPCTADSCDGDGACVFGAPECPEDLPPETMVWTGQYECAFAQGVTHLDLTTTRDPATNAMTGIFAFGPLPENPSIASGSWAMAGSYSPDDNSMRLLPTHWIEHPDGWEMVGMQGTYDGPMQQIHGDILMADGSDNWFCQEFDLDRVP